MKITRFAFAALLCGGWIAMQARADELSQPASLQTAALTYDYYAQDNTAPSPSDMPLSLTNTGSDKDFVYDDGKDGKGKGGCCITDCEPWTLFPEYNGWQLYGYLNGGATANADAPASHFNGPVTFNDRDVVMLNQAYGILEKVADGSCGWGAGGRVDVLWGSDYIFTQAVGLETHDDGTRHWNRSGNNYGWALPQAYAELANNNLSLKLGHFYAPMGYQVVMASGNFFISQPYTFQYGEPFTFTGALATYNYSDTVTLYGAVVNGWDKFDATTDRAAFMWGINYAPCHERYSIYYTGIVGEEDGTFGTAGIQGTRVMNSLVFTYNFTDRTQYVFQSDVGWQENGIAPGTDAEWYGVNQYLFYTINDCWKLGARGEWFRDDDGARLVAAPVRIGGLGLAPATVAGNYYEFALGANWTPGTNLTIRPELRWD